MVHFVLQSGFRVPAHPAVPVHVQTGSQEKPVICVLGAQRKSRTQVLVLWTCLSNFSSVDIISDDIWSVMRKKSFICVLRFLFGVLNRCFFFQGAGLFSLLATLCTQTRKSLMVSLRPAESHIEQTVMRKRITVFHQQLSPAAPVSIKCTYIASGHAVAKEVLVSNQKLAGKHPQSWFKRLDATGDDFKLHPYFIYVYEFSEAKGGKLPGHL